MSKKFFGWLFFLYRFVQLANEKIICVVFRAHSLRRGSKIFSLAKIKNASKISSFKLANEKIIREVFRAHSLRRGGKIFSLAKIKNALFRKKEQLKLRGNPPAKGSKHSCCYKKTNTITILVMSKSEADQIDPDIDDDDESDAET